MTTDTTTRPDPRIRVGICGRKHPLAAELGPLGLLQRCADDGYDGVFFRTILDVAPDLDPAVLADVRALADDLGLYLEMGLGKINPFNTSEDRTIRDLGAGDYLLGMTRMIEAATAVGCRELWGDTANYQGHSWGLFAIDRFRTDVSWDDQLRLTAAFAKRLVPVLEAHDAHLAIETHEEITTDEIVRMAEDVGERFGVTLDLANVVVRGEDPVAAARRVAPFVRQTHMRDFALFRTPQGLRRQIRAVGDGVVDWSAVLGALADAGSTATWTIENSWHDHNDIPLSLPEWRAAHPDLRESEIEALGRLADEFTELVARGERPDDAQYHAQADPMTGQLGFLATSAARLRSIGAAIWQDHS
ncbi:MULTISPECIES: sugar phosphate isomerase/epimerase family protein [unclassified Microbacterium]|uniref:sugar phosphate isomerase/epimerase family protein n=1 Tax=unclassified Microbacterium TaxID=2609290 RepID=UPI00365B0992